MTPPIDSFEIHNLDRQWRPILSNIIHDSMSPVAGDQIDGRGVIDARELELELKNMHRYDLEYELGISWNKIKSIIRRSDFNRDGRIHYSNFLQTVQRYRLSSEQSSKLNSIVRSFAYAEEFSLCDPPPLCMLFITALEIASFIYYAIHLTNSHQRPLTWDGPVPFCSTLIYDPYRRREIWRFFTYIFIHIGFAHFIFNMFMQVMVGVALELQQEGFMGSFNVFVIYTSGVIAGSLGTSVVDPNTYIAGASGGVYALISAHLATLILNWSEDSAVRMKKVIYQPLTKVIRLSVLIFLSVHDTCVAIYFRFYSDEPSQTGFTGHLCGALAGLLVGVFILDNRHVKTWEVVIGKISLLIFLGMIVFGVSWNLVLPYLTSSRYFPDEQYGTRSECEHHNILL